MEYILAGFIGFIIGIIFMIILVRWVGKPNLPW